MNKRTLIAVLCLVNSSLCLAQGDAPANNRLYDHFVGVQVNNLLKQVFNSGGAATNNPYMLNYSMNSKKTGWGFRIGVGYNHGNGANNSGSLQTNSSGDDVNLRIGVERAYSLSKRWSTGVGIDFVLNNNNDNNSSTTYDMSSYNPSYPDTVTNSTRTLVTTFGGGVMGWLRYNINQRIVVGTESSLYYVMGNKKQTVDYHQWNNLGSVYMPIETRTSNSISSSSFNAPIVFFLMVKF